MELFFAQLGIVGSIYVIGCIIAFFISIYLAIKEGHTGSNEEIGMIVPFTLCSWLTVIISLVEYIKTKRNEKRK